MAIPHLTILLHILTTLREIRFGYPITLNHTKKLRNNREQ
jgi:hypothetical protein